MGHVYVYTIFDIYSYNRHVSDSLRNNKVRAIFIVSFINSSVKTFEINSIEKRTRHVKIILTHSKVHAKEV